MMVLLIVVSLQRRVVRAYHSIRTVYYFVVGIGTGCSSQLAGASMMGATSLMRCKGEVTWSAGLNDWTDWPLHLVNSLFCFDLGAQDHQQEGWWHLGWYSPNFICILLNWPPVCPAVTLGRNIWTELPTCHG